ncbi:class I SAM-dependent methyltransferase [Ahrensia sp. R2A130]|uniref:class I SAM-dependent methyltransferase n=1 Tax=Ahrensia sp. R2A130 TaxID=744979 RepID=UPI0001E0D827|nr:SAM dependent methyltransferase [Ahrensia sp. R2A130]
MHGREGKGIVTRLSHTFPNRYTAPMAKPGFKRSAKRKSSRPYGGAAQRGGKPVAEVEKPKAVFEAAEPLLPRERRSGNRLPQTVSQLLLCEPSPDYALLDTGNGEKLERYGTTTIRRPEGQAMWLPHRPASEWDGADATFTGDTDEEGPGRWKFSDPAREERFPLEVDGLPYWGRFTSFRHTGIFPEQVVHWRSMVKAIEQAPKDRPVSVLNLFGYTGLASLMAARAGAHVTHVDASKKAIGWARENAELAGLADAPIRWICDDAMKFCQRDVRREQTYDIILLDPPAYGRGPKGEVWQLFDHLPHMLDAVRDLQSERPLLTILTAYAIRASHLAMHEIMQEVMAGMDGRLESGELVLRHASAEQTSEDEIARHLTTSMYCRFIGSELNGVNL